MRLANWWNNQDAPRRLILLSAAGLALLLGWASVAQVDSITRGMGRVIPSSKAQLIQPSEPAVVAEILVRGGQAVKEGQLLVRLDDAQSASALGQLETENQRLAARAVRLEQEASGRAPGCGPGTACSEERRLQQTRVSAAKARERSLAAAVEQRRGDKREADATVAALGDSVALAREQVQILEPLASKGIVPRTEILAAKRDLVDVEGRLAAAKQAAARAAASISQAEADLNSARLAFRQEALDERADVTDRMAVNEQTIVGAQARQQRNELRAPTSGIVNDVQVNTVGGFVNAGEQIMQIVPIGDRLLVEARIRPGDIGFIKVGDRASVKVTAYDFSIYGGLTGTVRQVSADSIFDEVDREAYYTVLVETDRSYINRGAQRYPIMPGMMCDVEILTGRRSILSYLFKPIAKAFDSALTER
jgi:adhesin transport system membrane fusion protein